MKTGINGGREMITDGRTGEIVIYLLEQHGPRLRELGRIRERVKAMNRTRLELVKANNSLKKKLGEFKL